MENKCKIKAVIDSKFEKSDIFCDIKNLLSEFYEGYVTITEKYAGLMLEFKNGQSYLLKAVKFS